MASKKITLKAPAKKAAPGKPFPGATPAFPKQADMPVKGKPKGKSC